MGWNITEMEAGSSVVLTFRVTVSFAASQQSIIANQATYAMDYEGIPQNDLPNSSNIVEHILVPTDVPNQNPIIDTGDMGGIAPLFLICTALLAASVGAVYRRKKK